MKYHLQFLAIVCAILTMAACNKEYNPRPPSDEYQNMLINKALITILPGTPDVFLDIDQDGVNDFAIRASRITSHGGTSGYLHFTLMCVNPNFELFGFIDQDTIWHSCTRDTFHYPDYVFYGESNYYTCQWSSPAQTIHRILQNVHKPYYFFQGDNFNPMAYTFNETVDLYKTEYAYGSYFAQNPGYVWAKVHSHANNCFNIPENTEIILRFAKFRSGNKRNLGWIRMQLITGGSTKLEIIEQAIELDKIIQI